MRTELTTEESSQAAQCPMPALRFRTAPGEPLDPLVYTVEPRHDSVYIVPGAANVELVHGVLPASTQGASALCQKLVRIAMITWIY